MTRIDAEVKSANADSQVKYSIVEWHERLHCFGEGHRTHSMATADTCVTMRAFRMQAASLKVYLDAEEPLSTTDYLSDRTLDSSNYLFMLRIDFGYQISRYFSLSYLQGPV